MRDGGGLGGNRDNRFYPHSLAVTNTYQERGKVSEYEPVRVSTGVSGLDEMLGGGINIEVLPSDRKAHYKITPYNFSPKLGRKIVNNPHIDMGQGLLQCMADINDRIANE